LSEITVKVHRGSAMHKLGAKSIADLVRIVDALGVPRQ
jgi:FixJ family two-component response regulator